MAVGLVGHRVSLLGPPSFDDCGEPQLEDELAALGYTHMVVRPDRTGEWIARAHALPRLVRGPTFPDSWILEVRADKPAVYVSALLGFGPREYEEQRTWRWMGQTGALHIASTRESPGTVLAMDLRAFPHRRRVSWLLDGRRLGEVEVEAGWREYDLPLGPLVPHRTSTLTLSCREPAIVANDVLHNHDHRALALAVGKWTLREDTRQAQAPSRNRPSHSSAR